MVITYVEDPCNAKFVTLTVLSHCIAYPYSAVYHYCPHSFQNQSKQSVLIDNMEAVLFLSSITFVIAVTAAIIRGYD